MLIEKVLPAIKEKWPRVSLRKKKRIQQDNAPAHIKTDDKEFLQAVKDIELDVKLYGQPANSPDTNINDLAFFASIQALQHQIGSGNKVGTLIDLVNQAFS